MPRELALGLNPRWGVPYLTQRALARIGELQANENLAAEARADDVAHVWPMERDRCCSLRSRFPPNFRNGQLRALNHRIVRSATCAC